MKVLSLFVVFMALLWSGVAGATMCRPIEYAEVQDMLPDDLAETYCSSTSWAHSYSNTYHEWMMLALRDPLDHQRKQYADEAYDEMHACLETLIKIERTLKKRGMPKPSCEGPRPKPTR